MRNRSEVLAAYHTYLDAFVASNEDAIHAQFVWPCAFIRTKKPSCSTNFHLVRLR